MSELNLSDVLGGGKSAPSPKFTNVGDKFVGQITGEPKAMPVREFLKGKPGEQLFFQGQKVVKQSDLNLQLPFNPVPQVMVPVTDRNGTEWTLWLEGEKLKALKLAIKNDGVGLAQGNMIAVEFSEEKDTGAPFPKKLYKVQLKENPSA